MATKLFSNQTNIKIVYYYFKILGLFTVSLKFDSDGGNNLDFSIFLHLKNILYNYFLISLTLVIQFLNINILYNTKDIYSSESEKIVDLILTGLNTLKSISLLIIYASRRKTIKELVFKVSVLKKLTFRNNDKFCAINLANYAEKVFSLSSLFWIVWVATSSKKYMISDLSMFFCVSIINSVVMQYVFVLKLLKMFFQANNANLSAIKELSIRNKHFINMTKEISNNRNIYLMLIKISDELSSFYGKPMLLYISHIFLSLVLSSYYIFKPVVMRRNSLEAVMYAHCLIYAIVMIFSLSTLTNSVSDVIAEVMTFSYSTNMIDIVRMLKNSLDNFQKRKKYKI